MPCLTFFYSVSMYVMRKYSAKPLRICTFFFSTGWNDPSTLVVPYWFSALSFALRIYNDVQFADRGAHREEERDGVNNKPGCGVFDIYTRLAGKRDPSSAQWKASRLAPRSGRDNARTHRCSCVYISQTAGTTSRFGFGRKGWTGAATVANRNKMKQIAMLNDTLAGPTPTRSVHLRSLQLYGTLDVKI